ncbi:MAG: hypothetical protein EPN39_01200 [Chitinophagaceae bacterium]|nr:MAG: hypothetical protein EPN39_01200 [Chitinophagaceae bacterium]
MKSFINPIIRKWAFRGIHSQDFFAVHILSGSLEESVWFRAGKEEIDISRCHSVACERPFCIAVCLPALYAGLMSRGGAQVYIKKRDGPCAKLVLKQMWMKEVSNHIIVLYEINSVVCYQLSRLRQLLLLRYFLRNKRKTFKEGQIYGALYSYPRRVIVVSYKEGNYYNIFPMDFQCQVEGSDIYMFGLRTSNITVEKIIHTGRLVVSDTDAVDIKTIYDLGRHHSIAPPLMNSLAFNTSDSEDLKFPVPSFSSGYKEIELIDHYQVGSHWLLIGRVFNSKQKKLSCSPLYHVHFFEFIKSNYKVQDYDQAN